MLTELRALCKGVDPARRLYSQGEEDAVLDALCARFGISKGYFVEIGVGPGVENNTRRCAEAGWTGDWFDCIPVTHVPRGVAVVQGEVTPANVIDLLRQHVATVPVDVFSLDIDGNDYWIGVPAIHYLKPKIVIVEYNATWGDRFAVMDYVPGYVWHQGQPCGASLAAWVVALNAQGYDLIYTTDAEVNAFFVKR